MGAKLTDLQMFAKAGSDREVRLDTLLSIVAPDVTKNIGTELKHAGLMASIGMTRMNSYTSVMALVAGYMGWLPVEVPEDAAPAATKED